MLVEKENLILKEGSQNYLQLLESSKKEIDENNIHHNVVLNDLKAKIIELQGLVAKQDADALELKKNVEDAKYQNSLKSEELKKSKDGMKGSIKDIKKELEIAIKHQHKMELKNQKLENEITLLKSTLCAVLFFNFNN